MCKNIFLNKNGDENFSGSQSGKQEEILSLDIPLNGSAGLGISLKALSRKKNDCTQDCGIFIKRVFHEAV